MVSSDGRLTFEFKWVMLRAFTSTHECYEVGADAIRELPEHGYPYVYEPLKEQPCLFAEFLSTPLNHEGILRFARRYGLIGMPEARSRMLDAWNSGETTIQEDDDSPEPVLTWYEEILAMRSAYLLRKHIDELDHRWLRDHVITQDGSAYFAPSGRGGRTDQGIQDKTALMAVQRCSRLFRTDLSNAAARSLTYSRLSHHVLVTGLSRKFSQIAVGIGLSEVDFESGRLVFKPCDLRSALWLQFGLATEDSFDRDVDYRACENCGSWFLVPSHPVRRGKRFCSPKCKVAMFRSARRMKEGGS